MNDIATNASNFVPTWQVVVMGITTVFVCLIMLILICMLTSAVIRKFTREKAPAVTAPRPAAPVLVQPTVMPNKQEMVAAIGVAVAEHMGTDCSRLRIHSIRQIGGVTPAAPQKQQLIAAVGVAIAEATGTDVSRLRIHSIKKI